jgi:eukaryotic-like serine/threonine-protein kinase
MTTEYWRQVWRLCEEARRLSQEERAAYVRAHAPDAEMAREVLSLLEQPEGSIIPSWSTDVVEDTREVGSLAGTRVGRFALGELLGFGASGEVYSAFDAELERMVAIKFLRCGDADGGWRAEGFLREARAASALNHPGIVTVHEVMQSEAGLAIVMELVEGRPLRKLCGAMNEAADVARWGAQAAGALAAAHGAKIIHRDIKPENIVLRPDGLTKVLDFGLAQRGARPDGSKAQLAGTLRYMSPEQAAQKELTPASDVYSLGLVLYELLAGRHPLGSSHAGVGGFEETLQAAQEGRVEPVSRWRRDVPKAWETLLREMLRKAPEERPSAAEVARRLESLPQPGARGGRIWWVGAVAALAFAAMLWTILRGDGGAPENFGQLVAVPLTATAGFDSWPDISPDGKTIAYSWGKSPDAYSHLYLKDLNQDAPIPLLESDVGARIGHPRWARDGQRVFYKRTSPRSGGEAIWSVGRDGKDARKEVDLGTGELSSGVDLSLDGQRIVYADRTRPTEWRFDLYLYDFQTKEKRRITTTESGWGDWDPRFSPDGTQIAFKRVKSPGDDQLYLMPSQGGVARSLNLPRESVYGFAWTPESNILLAGQLGSVIHGLWLASPAGKAKPTPIFESAFDATMPAVNRERVVWVNRVNDYNIYSAPLAGGEPVKRISSPVQDSRPSISADGRLAFVSRRSGSPEIWLSRLDGGEATRATDLKGELTRPAWSPDGGKITFAMLRFGISKIYVSQCPKGGMACEAPRELIEGTNPTWTADGGSIYYRASSVEEIRLVPEAGGETAPVGKGEEALASADGKWLYITRSSGSGRYFRLPATAEGLAAGSEELVMGRGSNSAGLLHWTLAGDELIFWESSIETKFSGLRAYNVVTKKTRTIVEAAAAEYPAVSPDGKYVWYAQPDLAGGTLMSAERRR